jgi:hypothetical protein
VNEVMCRHMYLKELLHTGGEVKGTLHPRTGHVGPEGEKKYSSTLSFTLALDGDQRYTLAALPLGKTRYPLYGRLGGL